MQFEATVPSVYDRVCQQALVNRLEPIFEKVFDPSSFGYRKGRKTADALAKIWREVEAGNEWIVDADLKDYFGSVDHEKLMALLGKQIADSGVLKLIQQMLKAGYEAKGQRFETPRGTPQGGVISPLLSNILLTPFDKEMRQKGYRLTRWADDWVVTCRTRAEAEHALARAGRILETLGVTLNREKTRIVHIAHGFEFLGFKIQRGKARLKLTRDRIKSKLNRQNLYAIPTQKSVDRFKDQIRALTMRRIPLRLGELIETINPIIRGWGNYYCRSHVRKRFHQLDGRGARQPVDPFTGALSQTFCRPRGRGPQPQPGRTSRPPLALALARSRPALRPTASLPCSPPPPAR